MSILRISTLIRAPAPRVFDLARSIDAHVASTEGTAERAIAGVTSGLIEDGQTVTWEARHLGVTQHLTVRITKMQRPNFFEDEMVSGAFERMHHRHEFTAKENETEMMDLFDFAAPLGPLGQLAEWLFLRSYMDRLLRTRAAVLKRLAESEEWRKFIPEV